jgi:two-component system, NtrC family, response regulator HydG
LKAEDLTLEEVITFSEGHIDLHGRRLVLHSVHAMAQFRKDLIDMAGIDTARRVLTRFGYFWGHADAAAMKRVFEWDSDLEWLKAGPRMHTLQGVTRALVKAVSFDSQAGQFRMELVWHDSGEAEEHLMEFGRSDAPICWMLTGYASGYASFVFGRNVYFVEEKCRGKGDRVCTAVGQDEQSWGDTLKAHLPYFQAEEIQGKILTLTRELRDKMRELARQRRHIEILERAVQPHFMVEVRSESFRRALELASRAAPYDSSVLILGESGVGKEVLARYIHAQSPRGRRPFVAVNCAALPETLLEGELFGHKAGAFTGATHDRTGLFEEAQGATIFLDEIGDITPAMQLKLLRVLQQKEIMRVGESRPRRVDVRVIAATNRDLPRVVREGRFREDLYYRLAVIEVTVPPLRDRRDDILPLARHFVKQMADKLNMPRLRLDATSLDYLQGYSWPGNVRELENAIERAAVLGKGGVISPDYLPSAILRAPDSLADTLESSLRTLAEVESDHIQTVLKSTNGNRGQAARILGISPVTLWRKLK